MEGRLLGWWIKRMVRRVRRLFRPVGRLRDEVDALYLLLYRLTHDWDHAPELPAVQAQQAFAYHLMSPEEKHRFLLKKAGGDQRLIHNLHDLYAPLIDRRFEFGDIRDALKGAGFTDITRTIQHTELFIRAVKGDAADLHYRWFLPVKAPPYWFSHH